MNKQKKLSISVLMGVIILLSLSIVNQVKANYQPEDYLETSSGYATNNEFNNATYISFDYYEGLSQGNPDWYRIWIESGKNFQVNITFDNSKNNMFLELFNDTYTTLQSSYMYENYESITWSTSYSGYYYIQVGGANNFEYYDMEVYLFDYSISDDDTYEENDNWYRAYYIGNNSTLYNMKNYDNDFFKIPITEGKKIQITLNQSTGTYSWFSIKNQEQKDMEYGYSTGTGTTTLSWTVNYTGYLYLGVYGSNLGSYYHLNILIINIDDSFEDNDEFNSAHYIYSNSSFNDLKAYDDDWYRIPLSPGQGISTFISYSLESYFVFELYDHYGSYLSSGTTSNTVTQTESHIDWGPISGYEDLYLKVNTSSSDPIYNMNIGIISPSDDGYEYNSDFANASTIYPNNFMNLKLIGSDEDYYKIWADVGNRLCINVNFNHYEGDINFEVYASNQYTIVGSGSSQNDNENLCFEVEESNNYYIRVFHAPDSQGNLQTYSLDIWKEPLTNNPASVDWVSFNVDDTYAWDITYKFQGDPYYASNFYSAASAMYTLDSIMPLIAQSNVYENSGVLSLQIDRMYSGGVNLGVDSTFNWPFHDTYTSYFANEYYFDVFENGQISHNYFYEIAAPLVGKNFRFDQTPYAENLTIINDLTATARFTNQENGFIVDLYLKYTSDGVLETLDYETYGDIDGNTVRVILSMDYNKEQSSSNNFTDNPFSSIPGYPIGIIGLLSIFSLIAVGLYRKKH